MQYLYPKWFVKSQQLQFQASQRFSDQVQQIQFKDERLMEKQLVYDIVQLFLGAKTTNYVRLQTHRSEGQILQTVRLEMDQSVSFQLQTLAQKCVADSLQHRQNVV